MIRKYLLPVLAVAGLVFAIWTMKQAAKPVPAGKPVSEPPRSPCHEIGTRGLGVAAVSGGILYRVSRRRGCLRLLISPLLVPG